MSVIARHSIHLVGSHIHWLLSLDISSFLNPFHTSELSISSLKSNLAKLNVLHSLDFLFIYETVQVSAELISTLEIILSRLRGNSIKFGGVLIICKLDHTKLEPVKAKPFLVSYHILS